MNKLLTMTGAVGIVLGMVGCTLSQPKITQSPKRLKSIMYSVDQNLGKTGSFQDTIERIANDLMSKVDKEEVKGKSVAITSFVDLHRLNKTTSFGRTLSEGLFNELHKKDLSLKDLRVQKEFSVNANGEYFLSRDLKRLNESTEADFALIGTYSEVEEGILLNARVVHVLTGKVIATSRLIYGEKNCEILETCQPEHKIARIKISDDGCSPVECPVK